MNTLALSTRDGDLENPAELISDDDIDYAAMASEDSGEAITFRASDYKNDTALTGAVVRYLFGCCKDAAHEAPG